MRGRKGTPVKSGSELFFTVFDSKKDRILSGRAFCSRSKIERKMFNTVK